MTGSAKTTALRGSSGSGSAPRWGRPRLRTMAWGVLVALMSGLAVAACDSAGGSEGAGKGAEPAAGGTPGEGPVPAPVAEFDADSAFALLAKQVAFGPRVPNTPPHQAQLVWMTDFLRARADTVILQAFTQPLQDGGSLDLTNVFARFRPDASSRILLAAHWDTRPTADQDPDPANHDTPIPGANDGASGVAVLMELANVLASHSPPIGVDLLFVDGEDWGEGDMFLGSDYFAAHTPPGYSPLYGVVVDMVADQSPRFPIEKNSLDLAPEVVDRVWRTAEGLGYGDIFSWSPGLYINDDHIPLNQAGIRTVDIIDFEYGPQNRFWHTLQDDMQHVAPQGLQAVGRTLATLIYRGG